MRFNYHDDGWLPSDETVREQARLMENLPYPINLDEAAVPEYRIPEILEDGRGGTITTVEQWRSRREQLLHLFRKNMYGFSPAPFPGQWHEVVHVDEKAMGGEATLKLVDIHVDRREDAPVIHLILFVPNKRQGPVPVNLLICNRDPSNIDPTRSVKSEFWPAEAMIERGYAAAAYHYRDIANDDPTTCFSSGVFAMMGGPDACTDESWGALGAWAWGGSRVMDYFESDPNIDARHCAVTGHSRGGKTALWCGAQDERWAMAVSSCSGCGGATLSRRFLGETVEALVSGPYYWFCRNFRAYAQQVDKLPFDQHMLIALMAPRLVYVSSATEDLWADPRGEWQATWLARPVWRLYGMSGLNGEHMPSLAEPDQGEGQAYHIHPGIHTYCLYDWQRNMDFTDRMYRRD